MKDSDQDVLIVVLNYNGEEFIEDCLNSIRENTTYPEANYDVVVVDNNSQDNSLDKARPFCDEIIENNRNLGFDIGNNIALYENPDYEYYLLLNNDTEVHEKWLKRLLKAANEEDAGIVGPKILNPDETIQSAGYTLNGLSLDQGEGREFLESRRKVQGILGAAMLISRDVVEEIGYLDEIFTPGNAEESDYCYRAESAGFDIYVEGKSEVTHKSRLTKKKLDNKFSYLMALKNPIKSQLMNGTWKNIAYEISDLLKRPIASAIGYGYNPIDMVLRSYLEVMRDLPMLLRKRSTPDRYVPSYYCEGIKDYSKRYEDLQ